MSRVSPMHHQLVPVPIPDRVAQLIGRQIPLDVLQAEANATFMASYICRYRPLDSDEDRADREDDLGKLAAANKVLAQYDPRLIVRGAA